MPNSVILTTTEVVDKVVKVGVMDFIQANAVVSVAIGFCVVCCVYFIATRNNNKRRY